MNPLLIVLALANFAIGTGAFVIAGIVEFVADGLHISVPHAGQLMTIYAAAYAIGSPLLVAVSGRIDRKRVLLAGLLTFLIGNTIIALASGPSAAFAGRALAALGAAVVTPTSAVIAVQSSPASHRTRALSLVFMGISLAYVAGVPIGTYLAGTWNWRAPFIIVCALTVIALAAVALRVPSSTPMPGADLDAFKRLFSNAAVMLAVAFFALMLAAQFTVFTYLGGLVAHYTGVGPAGLSALVWIFGIAGVAGNVIGGIAADRLGAMRTLLSASFLIALALAAMPLMRGSIVMAALILALWGSAGFVLMTPQQSRLIGLAPQAANLVLALNASALYVGTALGASIGGAVLTHGGYGALGWWALALVGFALATLVVSQRLARTPLPASLSA